MPNKNSSAKPGTERHRDEQRKGGPRYHGHSWRAPDAPASDQDPIATGTGETSGEQAGVKRGEKPRKSKDRA